MTIPRYAALQAHWRLHPRPEWLIASYLGYKPPPEIIPAQARRLRAPAPTGSLQNLFSSLGGTPGQTVVMR